MDSMDLVPGTTALVPLSVLEDSPAVKQDPVLLVYPFVGGSGIEFAAQGLDLYDFQTDCNEYILLNMQLEHTNCRCDFMSFTQRDFNSLCPGTFVNDCIIGFWMSWIHHNEIDHVSMTLCFTTYLYNTLIQVQGNYIVSSWCHNRNLDVFSKKMSCFQSMKIHIGHCVLQSI